MTKLQNKTKSISSCTLGSAGSRAELPAGEWGMVYTWVEPPSAFAFRVETECPRPDQCSGSAARGVQGAQSCAPGPSLVFHLVSA